MSQMPVWQDIASRKKAEQQRRLPRQWQLASKYDNRDNVLGVPRESGLLTADELRLTEDFDALALVAGLTAGVLSSVDVVGAFCKKAAIAHQLTNCLTEILFEDALQRARQLDEHLASTGKPKGPLHGLPISLKDSFRIKGYDSSIGVAAFCFKPATENSALVDLLLEAGAVLYCKTNVPQMMGALDSHNNVFGRTLNPTNKLLSVGGSTGGEAALLAMGGSVLGVGTDVGGSIRIPALCNGLYGIKPSHGRVPFAGQEEGMLIGSSKLSIEATAGPIARSLRDCELLLRVICDSSPSSYDPDVFSQSWAQQTSLSTSRSLKSEAQVLRVGVARTDGHATPLPPMQHLIDEVVTTLSGKFTGIEVIEIDISSLASRCVNVFNGLFSIDGSNTLFDQLEQTGEPLSPWTSSRLERRPHRSLDEVRKLQAQKTDLETELLKVWKEGGSFWCPSNNNAAGDRTLDVIICPAAPHPVPPIDGWNSTNYTSMFNLFDLPAGTMPIRSVTMADLREELPKSEPLNGWDKINRELWTSVDRNVYLDSPLSIQVVAPRLMERKLVDSMAVLEQALRSPRESKLQTSKL